MADLIVTHDQAKVLAGATVPVAIRDPDGNLLGFASPSGGQPKLHGFTPEEIARSRQIADLKGPWYTTEQVRQHLRSLEQK
jgi:hypothetical protein